ncbi:MAG: superoxide dismutase family protein [Acidobacteriota bacterium]
MKRIYFQFVFALATILAVTILSGCTGTSSEQSQKQPTSLGNEAPPVTEAVAELQPTEGNSVKGEVHFTQTDSGVEVTARITGLTPGKHGFHIHENGDCSAPDGSSAGGHFNPTGVDHGAPTAEVHHVGDLGNLEAGEDGVATYDETYDFLSLKEGAQNSILGRGVIVHAQPDDLTSQPTGAAGARVACGVIKAQ